MTIAYRGGASVVNGTAGTSVTIGRPAGTLDGDMLIAFVAFAGTAAPTAPAGWFAYGVTSNASGPVSLGVYWKRAISEPSTWTWTITSAINWGWVGAYTGVDPGAPIAATNTTTAGAGTVFAPGGVTMPHFALGVSAAAAVRVASGAATTWTPSGVEVADLSTNVGAGTDIAGEVQNSTSLAPIDTTYSPSLTASQSQAQGVSWGLTLNAYFALPKPADVVPVIVEAAMGANLAADPNTWTWTDLSSRAQGSVVVTRGRPDETSQTQPSQMSVTLDNTDGWLTPFNATSPWYLQWGEDTPIRVKQRYALADFLRFQGSVAELDPIWPSGNNTVAQVAVTALGRLATIETSKPVMSPMARGLSAQVGSTPPLLYYPFEDGPGATGAAEFFGGKPLQSHGGTITWATDSSVPGSAPLPHLGVGTNVSAILPAYSNTGQWRIEFLASIPSAPAADVNLLFWVASGTGIVWKVRFKIVDSTIRLEALGNAGEALGDTGISAVGLYGKPLFITVNAQQSGSNLNWQLNINPVDGSGIGYSHGGTAASFTLGTLTRVTVQVSAALDNMLFGHLAILPTADLYGGGAFSPFDFILTTGHAGEDAGVRVNRTCEENGISFDSAAITSGHLMGAQPVAAPMTILREAESADGAAILCDGMGSGITWLRLADRLNAPVRLALNAANKHVKLPFEPTMDFGRRIDDVTVTRTNGSSGRYTVAPGRRAEAVTINAADDSGLVDQASLRVALGTVPEMRAPTIRINLRDTPDLIPQWMRCDIGSRLTVSSPPSQYGPNGLDQVLEYYREEFDGTYHVADLTCFPYAPLRAFVLEDPDLGRLETGGSQLVNAVTATATSLTVTGIVEPYWTTSDVPHYADLDGEQVLVTAVSSVASDAFNRTVSNGWGNADTGQTWTTSGAAGDYSVTGIRGFLSLGSVNVARTATLALAISDFDMSTSRIGATSATGAPFDYGLKARISGSDFVDARLFANPGGKFTLAVRQFVGGVETLAGIFDAWLPSFAFPAMRFQGIGSTIRMKAWQTGKPEPKDWTATMTTTHLATGSVQVYAVLEPGNTNTLPVGVDFEDFIVATPQTFTVQRSINGVVKAHAAGAPIAAWKPAGLAM